MDDGNLGAYRELYLRHWWWRWRETLLTREIARLAAGHPFGRILDGGCGDGLFFAERRCVGDAYGIDGGKNGVYRNSIVVKGPDVKRKHSQ